VGSYDHSNTASTTVQTALKCKTHVDWLIDWCKKRLKIPKEQSDTVKGRQSNGPKKKTTGQKDKHNDR
jgi:hypothetical protein